MVLGLRGGCGLRARPRGFWSWWRVKGAVVLGPGRGGCGLRTGPRGL